ncbi:hypothetical protein SCUP234_09712 [Seiridium cupressi]
MGRCIRHLATHPWALQVPGVSPAILAPALKPFFYPRLPPPTLARPVSSFFPFSANHNLLHLPSEGRALVLFLLSRLPLERSVAFVRYTRNQDKTEDP